MKTGSTVRTAQTCVGEVNACSACKARLAAAAATARMPASTKATAHASHQTHLYCGSRLSCTPSCGIGGAKASRAQRRSASCLYIGSNLSNSWRCKSALVEALAACRAASMHVLHHEPQQAAHRTLAAQCMPCAITATVNQISKAPSEAPLAAAAASTSRLSGPTQPLPRFTARGNP